MSAPPARLAALLLALLGTACPKEKGAGNSDQDDSVSRCEAVRPRVEALYRREQGEPPESEKERALAEEILEANVHMVLEDCKTDASRFVPCIEKADSAARLERECLIPLDDEGKVEGERFGGG